ncbi:MAG: cyclase family protein [Bacillota bacterium]|nr:cyclase family protein [Bacillota bacterium]
MILHDISRDILKTSVYAGDPESSVEWICQINDGDGYNLSQITVSSHCATHIDAPSHFINGGNTISEQNLKKFYGACTVVTIEGILTGEDMEKLLPYCKKRVLFKGGCRAFVSPSAAIVLADSHVILVGTDAQSIATINDESKTHRELLGSDIAILEGLDLSNIHDGEYLLCAFPLKISGLEASPCRAVLLEQEKGF